MNGATGKAKHRRSKKTLASCSAFAGFHFGDGAAHESGCAGELLGKRRELEVSASVLVGDRECFNEVAIAHVFRA